MFIGQIVNIRLNGRAETQLTYNAYMRADSWAKDASANARNYVKSVIAQTKEDLSITCKAKFAHEVIPSSLTRFGVSGEHFIFDISYFDASSGSFWSTSPQTISSIS